MTARANRLVAAGLMAFVALHAAPVRAGVAPLKRSVENILQAPLDAVLTPVVAADTARRNVGAEEHSGAGYAVLGALAFAGFGIFDSMAAAFRFFTGVVEFPVGLVALAATPFTDKDPPAFFDVSETPALVDRPSEVFDVKFGVYHLGR